MLSVLARLPGQVKRINGNAMAAKSGTGIKCHVAKRLGLCRLNHFPYVDSHRGIDDLEFVDQGYVDAAENVLEQLGRLCRATRANWNDPLNCDLVERRCPVEAVGCIATDDFRNGGDLTIWITRIFAFRGEREKEVKAGF